MQWRDRIIIDPEILAGKPVIKGTQISVETVVDCLARGWTVEQVLNNYDHLSSDDIRACLLYVAETLKPDDDGGGAAMIA
jgi:uncharacterized protein (DUF433 family)